MEMPGHDVGVMLHHESTISSPSPIAEPEARRDQIDRLGRRAREHDLVDRAGVEEAAHAFARRLVGVRRGVGEIVQAAMHVGIFVLVDMGQALDHRARLLRRSGVVEIDQRLAVGPLVQNGKIGADRLDVVGRGACPCTSLMPASAHARAASQARIVAQRLGEAGSRRGRSPRRRTPRAASPRPRPRGMPRDWR